MATCPGPARVDVGAAVQAATAALAHLEAPRAEAQALVSALLGVSRSRILGFPERPLSVEEHERLTQWLVRRARGEPLAYLTGQRAFGELELRVAPGVLVPRPETELLVELLLERLPPAEEPALALDLGTGSGAIALSAARVRPDSRWLATDRSAQALATAQDNARHLHIGNVDFLAADWWRGLAGQRFHLIASNPPYLAPDEPELTGDGLRHEPREALVGGCDGLRDLATIIAGAPEHLRPGGWLLLEHGHAQAAPVQALMRLAGFTMINTRADLAGQPRVTFGCHRGAA